MVFFGNLNVLEKKRFFPMIICPAEIEGDLTEP